MQSADSDKQSDQTPDKTKYFRTLVKSGHEGKLVESGESADFVEEPEEPTEPEEATEVSDEIRTKALTLLGLIEEYFIRPESEGRELHELSELANENDLAVLLGKLEKGHETSTDEEPVDVRDSIKQQIQLLLATKGVKEYFFGLLKKEVEYFKTAQPTLKRVELLQRVRERIVSGITKFYLRDKRSKGKLMTTTAQTIASLEEKKAVADREERALRASADSQTQSWLMVQELLRYKKELKESGFAKTESRKRLIERVMMDIAHGNKVFLVGSTGTGKTQLAMLVADLVNDEGFEIVSWHEGTTPRDLFGYREVWQDEGEIQSGIKKGPVAIAITEGRILIHDEYTTGSTRAQLSAKAQMNAKVGKKTKIPGFNGEIFTVEEGYGEVFTGNLRDERTKAREDMDPAILRMLSGIKVPFMPADELFKIILAEIIDDTGLLPLSRDEIALIKKLTQAAQLMQMCHDREIEKLEQSEYKDSIKQIFGGTLSEVHLDKSFLDTGTLLRMFQGWDLQRARGQRFDVFLQNQLSNFIEDPKFDMDKEERKLARTILESCGVLGGVPRHEKVPKRPYLLPSEIGTLFDEVIDEDITDTGEGEDEGGERKNLDGKLENLVNDQYEGAINLLKVSGLYNPSENRHPSKTKVKELLASSIKPAQLEAIGKMENPVLQIVPNRTCAEYETGLNSNKPMVNTKNQAQVDAFTSDWMKQAFGRADARDNSESGKITGWKIVVTEGSDAPSLLSGDDANKTLEERCEWFKSTLKSKGVSGIDIKSYMLLMMAGFLKTPPRPVDDHQGTDKTWTMLNAEEIFSARVPGGDWYDNDRRVYLYGNHTDDRNFNARFRASVVVECA